MFSAAAFAEKRVALVIGNSAYENVARLANPENDATAMSATLKQAGFDLVDFRRNLKIADMRRAFREFADKARDAGVAVVYYAGHGIEVDGTNYLIPVDATLERDLDVYDEAYSLDRILSAIEPAKQLRLVMLDACRDNPFGKTMKRSVGSRTIGRGLAKVEPNSPNTLIAFASKAGSTASDGDSKNSPFTSALVNHIARPGLDLRRAFGYVRDEVLKNTSNRQEPYVYGSLGGDDVALVPATTQAPAPSGPQAEIRRDYEMAERVGTREVWTAFLAQHPDGLYATLAKAQLNKIATEEARAASADKTRPADEKSGLAVKNAKPVEQAKALGDVKPAEPDGAATEQAGKTEPVNPSSAEPSQAEGKPPSPANINRQRTDKKKTNRDEAETKDTRPDEAKPKRAVASVEPATTSAGSRTCSQTYAHCLRDRRILGPASVAKCAPYFSQCMKTGVWHSGYHHYTGVVQR